MTNAAIVDLRSDTVTRPSAGMYQAMREAPVGDDVYGEDETVNRLEASAAQLLGKQAGLFLSSATQANLAAMLAHNARGEEVLLGDCYHIFESEAGGTSALGASSCIRWQPTRRAACLRRKFWRRSSKTIHTFRSRALWRWKTLLPGKCRTHCSIVDSPRRYASKE